MATSSERIRHLRKMLDMTLRKMSEETGIHYTSLCRMETGNSIPKSETCYKLLDVAKKYNISSKYKIEIDMNWLLPR